MPKTSRIAAWKEIAWKPAIALATAPWVLMGIFNVLKGEFLNRESQEKWQLRNLNPWPWWAWALMSSVILIAVIGESAFRVIRKRELDIDTLNDELQKQIKAERDAHWHWQHGSCEIISLKGEIQNKQVENESLEDLLKTYYELCGEPGSLRHQIARLAFDLYRFIEEKGPVPVIPAGAKDEERRQFIFKIILPFSQKLNGAFEVRFPQRLAWARDQLAEANFVDFQLNRAISIEGRSAENISLIADRLLLIAFEMDVTTKHENLGIPRTRIYDRT